MDKFIKFLESIFGCFHDFQYSVGIQVISLDKNKTEQVGSYYRECKKCHHYEIRHDDEWIDCRD